MTSGLQVLNSQSVEVLNTNDPILLVVYKGDSSTTSSAGVPWKGWPAPPIVFARPKNANAYLGGFLLSKRPNGNVVLHGTGDYEYVFCASAKNYGIGSIGKSGLETYDESRNLLFSTNYPFARIKQILPISGTFGETVSGPTVNYANFSGFSAMPWIGVRDATWSIPYPAGDSGSASITFMIRVNPQFNQLAVTMSDTLTYYYNQYHGKNMYYPLADIIGV